MHYSNTCVYSISNPIPFTQGTFPKPKGKFKETVHRSDSGNDVVSKYYLFCGRALRERDRKLDRLDTE